MNWINAKEITPPDNGRDTSPMDYVFVYIPPYGIHQGFFKDGEWHKDFISKFSVPVTHWAHQQYPDD
jgi:hypothetical protein